MDGSQRVRLAELDSKLSLPTLSNSEAAHLGGLTPLTDITKWPPTPTKPGHGYPVRRDPRRLACCNGRRVRRESRSNDDATRWEGCSSQYS